MENAAILLVEDDPNLGAVLHEYLQLKGFSVHLYCDGEQGWHAYRERVYDLCILDVMMPRQDGFALARAIREADADIPIIFLTARSMKQDRLEGFRIGADDYIGKPFSIEELLMRIRAVLRRTRHGEACRAAHREYSIGAYRYNAGERCLSIRNEERRMSGREAQLLEMLCANLNSIVKRESALKEIWGDDSYFNARSMDVYITKLRKHLKEDPAVRITNVHGIGYKLEVAAS